MLDLWNNNPRIDMSLHSGHIILILSQSIFALTPYLCSMISREAVNTNFIVIVLAWRGLEPMIYFTQGKHANHYTGDAVRYVNNWQ